MTRKLYGLRKGETENGLALLVYWEKRNETTYQV